MITSLILTLFLAPQASAYPFFPKPTPGNIACEQALREARAKRIRKFPAPRAHTKEIRENLENYLAGYGIARKERLSIIRTSLASDWLSRLQFGDSFFADLADGEFASAVLSRDDLDAWKRRSLKGLPAIFARTNSLAWTPEAIRLTSNLFDLHNLIEYAPLWAISPWSTDIKAAILDRIDSGLETETQVNLNYAARVLSWLVDTSNPTDRYIFEAAAKRLIQKRAPSFSMTSRDVYGVLMQTSLVPYKELPPILKNRLENGWIDFSVNPPLLNQNVHPLPMNERVAGRCTEMFRGHICSSVMPNVGVVGKGRGYIPVVLNGNVVGSVKKVGEPSMMALRNVFDEHGRLMLVAGGAYRMNNSISISRRIDRISLERLEVVPTDFIFNIEDDADLAAFWDLFLREGLVQSGYSRSLFDDFISEGERISSGTASKLWKLLLREINHAAIREQNAN